MPAEQREAIRLGLAPFGFDLDLLLEWLETDSGSVGPSFHARRAWRQLSEQLR